MDTSTYHSVDGIGLHQSSIKHLSQIRTITLRDLAEVVDQGGIKHGELAVHPAEILAQITQVILPKLANKEPSLAKLLVEALDELTEEVFAVVLHGVETDTLDGEGITEPLAPVDDIVDDFWVRVVEIRAHEVVTMRC